LTTWYSKAQSNTTLSGQVVNLETKEVLPFASVAVFNSKNLLINGSVASDDGRFIIKGLGEGKYNVKVSCIGHNNSQMEILIGKLNTNYDLGKIGLSLISTELGEVVVAGKNSEITPQLDKKTFDISNGIAQSGGSVMDAMKAMPGVTFDQEGKVILRGSDKVLVLIDGKQSSLTGFGNQKGLDNIPVANIERIEIINSPSAKYDASGMAGIINIVYKNERKFRQPGHLLSANLQYTKGWEDETYHINDSSQVRKQGRDVTSILAIEHTLNFTIVYYDIDPANTYFKQNDAYDYFSLFPNVRLAYKPNERNKLSLFFNRRIDRPGEPELRMYAKSDDHELIKVGNPYLRPQFTQSAELGYKTNWRNGSIFISGYIRSILDPYMRVYTQDNTNSTYDIILKSYANTEKAMNKGVELVISQQITKFWKFSGNMNV
jgi:hypothetical protein